MTEPEHPAVVHHYGSVATEVAICRKTAGLVDRSELGRLLLSGRERRLEHALGHAIGTPVPAAGHAVRLGDTWCCRLTAERAVVVAPASARARWGRLAREALVAGDAIACSDVSAESAVASLVGPRAGAVLAAAGLPHDLAPGRLAAGTLAGVRTTVLCDGPAEFLLQFGASIGQVWPTLLEVGRPLGLSPVGSDALGRLRAARLPPHVRVVPTGEDAPLLPPTAA